MSSTKENTSIKISRKKTPNSTKKSHKNPYLNNEDETEDKIINGKEFIITDFEEEIDEYNELEYGDTTYVKIIKYGDEFYLLSEKDLVYTVPTDMYFENKYLFNNKSNNYFKPEESNVYFFVGKRKKHKIIFDDNFLKYKERLKNYQKQNIELSQNNLEINDHILYLPENQEGIIVDISNIESNNVKIMINNEIKIVNIKNIELI